MRIRTVAAVLAVLMTTVAVAEAQGQGGEPGRGGRRGMSTGWFMMPPSPDTMTTVVGLDTPQRRRYTKLYDGFTKAMQPQRDSLRTLMGQIGVARQSGDTAQARQFRTLMRDFRTQWLRQRKTFDDSLHVLLTADQQKKFDDWRAAKRPSYGQRRPPR